MDKSKKEERREIVGPRFESEANLVPEPLGFENQGSAILCVVPLGLSRQ
ncbi:hypothetical protein Rcae01_05165 [Novipirellula caenicola]|uniref:Uncharacterized protein n=1 Tax=Novipirellula caenicola TaxID=1536901 RepID=A0ABP9VYK1_9BACT